MGSALPTVHALRGKKGKKEEKRKEKKRKRGICCPNNTREKAEKSQLMTLRKIDVESSILYQFT
jgi:hypothetical protein